MSDSVRKRIQEAFARSHAMHAKPGLVATPKVTKYEGIIEVVQPIAEPVNTAPRHWMQYSGHDIYDIPEPKPEKLETLFARAEKHADKLGGL
jgi:hypothetical protein